MDWNDLRFFLAVHREGTLAGAARVARVDATTVGRRLAALERTLATRLFVRTPEGLALTAGGERLVEPALALERAAMDLELGASGDDRRLDGTVRLAVTESMAVTFLAAALYSVQRDHPGIVLELLSGSGSLDLLRREADVALRAGARPTQQALVARRVGEVSFRLVASTGYLRANPWRDALEGHRLIGFTDELAQGPAARWLEARAGTATMALRTNSILTARAACEAGWGVAALPTFAARGLVTLGSEPIARVPLWLLAHEHLARTARVRAVMDAVSVAALEASR